MKKIFVTVLIALIFMCTVSLNSSALENPPMPSDFYNLSSESQSVTYGTEETTLTLKDHYDQSRTVYGDENQDYKVDLTNLTLKIKLQEIENFGRFTITFAESRTNQPLLSGSEGISFVFRATSDGSQLEIAILDAKNGELIDEMKGVQWAYLGSEETNWDHGVIGKLNGINGKILNAELNLKFQSDSASSGGTTFRPSMGSSLGVAIPMALFTARSLDITNLALIISTGEGNVNYNFNDGSSSTELSGSNMVLKVTSLEEPNTKKYRQSLARTELINQITTYVSNADSLKLANLPDEEYGALIQKSFDLTSLRNRDKGVQQSRIDTASTIITNVSSKIGSLEQLATDYQSASELLFDLNSMTKQDLTDAIDAKALYEETSIYNRYLTEEIRNEINQIISSINETLILRATIHFTLLDFENSVNVFKDNISTADPADILLAMDTRELVDVDQIALLDEQDKVNFNNRYEIANTILLNAIEEHRFEIEKQRVENYSTSVFALTDNSAQEAFEEAYALKPTVDLTTFTQQEKDEINALMTTADNQLKQMIQNVISDILVTYNTAVNPLSQRESLTNEFIENAIAAKYDEDLILSLETISIALDLDITSSLEILYENDRLVEVAQLFLDTTEYKNAVEDIEFASQLVTAYTLRSHAIENENHEIFSEVEKNEYQTYFDTTDALMNSKAKSFIDPAINQLEKEVKDDLSLNIQMNQAKVALRAIPDLAFLTNEVDYLTYKSRFDVAYGLLLDEDLYYFTSDESSSWYAQSNDDGVKLTGSSNQGIMNLQEPLAIDGLDMVFDYTKIGRIWAGEVNTDGVKTYPQNILVVNFMRDYGKIKDQSQGFSIYLNPNVLGELEVLIYGPDRGGQLIQLAQGKISGLEFNNPDQPFEIRIRIYKEEAPLNAYQVWINSLKLNLYFRDFINYEEDSPLYMSGYEVGSEVGQNIFIDDKAHVSFVLFGQDLTEEEKEASITVKMLNDKTFANYVAPLLPLEMYMDSEPQKLTYEKGESLDLNGLVIRVLMSDGSYKVIDNSLLQIGGFTSSSQGNKVVSLIYTEAGITLTKVIRVMIVDSEVIEPGNESNTGLLIGIISGSVVALGGIGVGLFFILKKKRIKI